MGKARFSQILGRGHSSTKIRYTPEWPMVFSIESVVSIKAGDKTRTMRPVTMRNCLVDGVKPSRKVWNSLKWNTAAIYPNPKIPGIWSVFDDEGSFRVVSPRVRPGHFVWVRESFCLPAMYDDRSPAKVAPTVVKYRDGKVGVRHGADIRMAKEMGRWRSPIYLPRWASRLRLRVINACAQYPLGLHEKEIISEGAPKEIRKIKEPVLRTTSLIEWWDNRWHGLHPRDKDFRFNNLPCWTYHFSIKKDEK